MSFSNMLEILQEKNKNLIVLIRLGVFYIATGKDAVFLNKELGLKCICYKNQECKIGIPESRIEYYLRIMYKNKWIDEKKFKLAIGKVSEIGKIVGGLIKYYAQNNKK